MKKTRILKYLAIISLIIPGNLKRKRWYLSFYTVTSVVGILFVIYSCFVEFAGFKLYKEERRTNEFLQRLKPPPNRAVAFCLSIPINLELKANASGNEDMQGSPSPPPYKDEPDFLDDFVSTSYRVLIFMMNFLARLFIIVKASVIVELFVENEGNKNTFGKRKFDLNKSLEKSFTSWSTCEKVFLSTIFLSQLQRQLEFTLQFWTSIEQVGWSVLDIPCLVIQIGQEQIKVLVAKEMAMEVATFALLIIMTAFVKMLWAICGEDSIISNEKNGKSKILERNGLFLKSELAAVSSHSNRNKIASIHDHISEVVGDELNENSKDDISLFNSEKIIRGKSENEIYEDINSIITFYFHLMTIWEKLSKLMGFITLLLFAELTSTFCFNTYMSLDASTNHGISSGMGICGILRGIVIIAKFLCVCNTAQALEDVTQLLLDRILKLKLKLLLNGKETSCKNKYSLPNGMGCERCRGLGSFLSEAISYIRGHPFQLSAMGYFTVSRSTLTTITGVIVTYMVVLVQFQSYASSAKF